jgi:hypothetical protein
LRTGGFRDFAPVRRARRQSTSPLAAGLIAIVAFAAEREVLDGRGAALGERLDVVELAV